MIKTQFILLALLITYAAALDINIFGDITAALNGLVNGDLNLGTSKVLTNGLLSLNSSAQVTGVINFGSLGILGLGASTPTLSLSTGAVLNCSVLTFNGGAIMGGGAIVIGGQAEFKAEGDINATFECASAVISSTLSTAGEFMVKGKTTIGSSIAFTAKSGSAVVFKAGVAGTGMLNAAGQITFGAKAEAEASATVAAALVVKTGGKAIVAANTTFTGLVQIASAMVIESEASLSGGVSIADGGVLAVGGSAMISGSGVSGSGSVEFNATSVKQSIITSTSFGVGVAVKGSSQIVTRGSGTVFGALSLSGSGSAHIESSSSVSGNLVTSGSSTIEINKGSLAVNGSVTLGADATYKVVADSATTTSVIAARGQATLGGKLVVETNVAITTSTRLVIMTYGSRASGSTFASVSVKASGSKRSLLEDGEYEVVYTDNNAYIQKSDNAAGSLFAAGLLLAFMALF